MNSTVRWFPILLTMMTLLLACSTGSAEQKGSHRGGGKQASSAPAASDMQGETEEQLAQGCQMLDFETVEVVPGIANETWVVVVSGTKPYMNMDVELRPLVYIRQPEYWGIEIIGCFGDIGLPALAPYEASQELEGVLGTKGIEVIGTTGSRKFDIPPS